VVGVLSCPSWVMCANGRSEAVLDVVGEVKIVEREDVYGES
jgi:hypothetical protein